ncbi:MAG: OmpH family outer membrane protein [Bacteriovoracaceae bacterium]|nr:OmpH family outer membrane protein [Bacteriovoracaceae bacterium]
MKKLITVIALALSFSAAAEVKIGLVNIQKVITSIGEGKSVMKTLEKSFKSKQKEIKAEEEAIKKLQQDYQKQSSLLSDKAKAKKEDEIRTKIGTLQRKTMEYQKNIQNQEKQLKKPILEKLKPVIDEVSKNKSVAMTFEVSSSPVVYAEKQIDITEDVIKAYDKKHK